MGSLALPTRGSASFIILSPRARPERGTGPRRGVIRSRTLYAGSRASG